MNSGMNQVLNGLTLEETTYAANHNVYFFIHACMYKLCKFYLIVSTIKV